MLRTRVKRHWLLKALACSSIFFLNILGIIPAPCLAAQPRAEVPEEVEWTWEVRPPHPDPKLPNVLLLGDSISRSFFPRVTEQLSGVANVYLMASTATVGDPRLEHQIAEFAAMEGVRFSVVHFNNGMHGWDYDEDQYEKEFPNFVRAVRKLVARHGVLIWATTTPVRTDTASGPTNRRIDARNAIAKSMLQSDGVRVDDQHELMMRHPDRYEDSMHFDNSAVEMQGDQAAATIKNALDSGR
jgi:hypothetical protein